MLIADRDMPVPRLAPRHSAVHPRHPHRPRRPLGVLCDLRGRARRRGDHLDEGGEAREGVPLVSKGCVAGLAPLRSPTIPSCVSAWLPPHLQSCPGPTPYDWNDRNDRNSGHSLLPPISSRTMPSLPAPVPVPLTPRQALRRHPRRINHHVPRHGHRSRHHVRLDALRRKGAAARAPLQAGLLGA